MAKCACCDSRILLGGTKWASLDCCDDTCVTKLKGKLVRQIVPTSEIEKKTEEIHGGKCPVCKGDGPVDIYYSKKVTGFIVAVTWSTEGLLCCQKCAKGHKIKAGIHCLGLGWWSPKALVTNLYYLPYNFIGAATRKSTLRPSKDLETAVVGMLADENLVNIRKAIKQINK